MERTDYLSTGIGVLKTLLGTYILIIAAIAYAGSKNADSPAETTAIESEVQEEYTVLSYNDKLFAVERSSYESFKNSGANETVLIDALGQEPEQTVINKDDILEIQVCNSYDEAVNCIAEIQNNRGLRK